MSSLASRADEWIRRNGDQMVGNLADAVYALETSALVRDLASALRDADERIAELEATIRQHGPCRATSWKDHAPECPCGGTRLAKWARAALEKP